MKAWCVAGMVAMLLGLGCARVRVEAPKEPIKVDISMRLDIYQHVKSDIDDIEGMVSGAKDAAAKDNQSLLQPFIATAYAQEDEGLSPEVKEAALRRKERYTLIVMWLKKGAVGENKSGLLDLRDQAQQGPALDLLIQQENSDRMAIYGGVARKNGIAVEEVQKLYAKRLQSDAPAGSPIEVLSQSTGQYEWKVK